jgi:hypothetical protein
MGILDWFKSRPVPVEPDLVSDEIVSKAVEKAVSLTNPRLKLIRSYHERLVIPVSGCVSYLREKIQGLPHAIEVSGENWAKEPVLRAFFANAQEIPSALGLSRNLRTFFKKFPELEHAYFVLGLTYNERHLCCLSLQDGVNQQGSTQTAVDFSLPRTRICGHTEEEVRRLLAAQSFEYLVAQAMVEIGEARSERLELEDSRNLIRARLRLLQQQGPGLGSVFEAAPASTEQLKLEARLLDNERQMEELGSSHSVLENELECLCKVLEVPDRYIRFERTQLRLSTLNVVVDENSMDVASDVTFTMAILSGVPKEQRAFVIGRVARSELPEVKLDIANAERYL